MGAGNILHPHAVLGGLPQDTGFKAETVSWLIIGDIMFFREGFTAHRASKEEWRDAYRFRLLFYE